jgi:hypothetical protein
MRRKARGREARNVGPESPRGSEEMISGPETITAHLNALIEHLQAGNAEQVRMRAYQALFDLQRLRGTRPDRSKGGSDFIIAAVQAGIDLGKINDLDRNIRSVVSLVDRDQMGAALEEGVVARERWLTPKEK